MKSRPSYPLESLQFLKKEAHITPHSVVADIGSGTGILTKELLSTALKVYGVEPNKEMQILAKEALSKFDNFLPFSGTAENTGIETESIDVITVAQAFHWFDAPLFKKECDRILKKDGRVVLLWNFRNPNSSLVKRNAEILNKYAPEFNGFSGGISSGSERIKKFYEGKTYIERIYPHDIQYDKTQFIERNVSISTAPKKGESTYALFIRELEQLFEQFCHSSNRITVPNDTHVFVG